MKIAVVLLAGAAAVLAAGCLYLWFGRRNVRREVEKTADALARLLEEGGDGRIMVFTGEACVKRLLGEINGLLEEKQRLKAGFCKAQLSSRRMLSNVSHDIKTPLTVLLGYLEIMQLRGEENRQDMLEKTRKKAEQVLEMVNQFFSLAKLEAGDAKVERIPICVDEICRSAVLTYYEMLTERGFEVEAALPEGRIFALGDAGALTRVMENLISNAVRYGADGHYLKVSAGYCGEWVEIRVEDRGRGISREALPFIFDRLYTMEDSRNREMQGSGLGLAIARSLAEQMGGAVEADSAPGRGACFTVRLRRV